MYLLFLRSKVRDCERWRQYIGHCLNLGKKDFTIFANLGSGKFNEFCKTGNLIIISVDEV